MAVLTVLLGIILVFSSGCSQGDKLTGDSVVNTSNVSNVTIIQQTDLPEEFCGDGKCGAEEKCNCADCVGDKRCSNFASVCDDGNNCTTDIFDTESEKCEHVSKETCCGDGRCEETERCDNKTLKTICPEDCGYECPYKLVMHEEGNINQTQFTVSCLGDCVEVTENHFQAAGNVQVFTTIENVGEDASGRVESNSFCSSDGKSKKDDGMLNGVNVRFYFNDHLEYLRYIDGTVKEQNYATYWIDFKPIEVEDIRVLTCNVDINSFGFNQTEKFEIRFLPEE